MTEIPSSLVQNRRIAAWLLVCCALVFAMVVLGGFTRLTGSGLSMAEWRPIMGAIPPLSDTEWQRVFEIYQQTPEFQKVNSHMDVDDFKGIFWLEYLHRVLGRLIGFAFTIPLIVFAVRRYISTRELPWYLLILAVGGAQAFIGKIMVASGQVDAPHVSPYRLTAHLAAAFAVFAMMFWTALSLLRPSADGARHAWFGRTVALTILLSVTILSGGFVAGLDAGMIYNTFPLMGNSVLPPGLLILDPPLRNFTENMTTVQFNHRLLTITTFLLIAVYWWRARAGGLPEQLHPATNSLLVTALLQVILGISTLLLAVPTLLAVSHQGVALLLFTIALYITHSLRKIPM